MGPRRQRDRKTERRRRPRAADNIRLLGGVTRPPGGGGARGGAADRRRARENIATLPDALVEILTVSISAVVAPVRFPGRATDAVITRMLCARRRERRQ